MTKGIVFAGLLLVVPMNTRGQDRDKTGTTGHESRATAQETRKSQGEKEPSSASGQTATFLRTNVAFLFVSRHAAHENWPSFNKDKNPDSKLICSPVHYSHKPLSI